MFRKVVVLLCVCVFFFSTFISCAEIDMEKLGSDLMNATKEERQEALASLVLLIMLVDGSEAIQEGLDAYIPSVSTGTKEIDVEESTNEKIGTRLNPIPLGDSVELSLSIGGQRSKIRISISDVKRGDEANRMSDGPLLWKPLPDIEKEYLVFKVNEEIIETENDAPLHVHSAYFHAVSRNGITYQDYASNISGYPSMPEMYKGAKFSAYMGMIVDVGDIPTLKVLEGYTDDKQPVFFSLE